MLEAAQHGDNAFLTLTYDDDHLPRPASLDPRHVRDFLKRLRRSIEPLKVRYFAVGEYGDQSERPHYHLALFGYPKCLFGNSRYNLRRPNCCSVCDRVRDVWGKGHVFLGDLSHESAAYIAGYVTKKMTGKDDARLNGRYPEFARMSLRPGIGQSAMHEVADVLLRYDVPGDVPNGLRHGSRVLPLGRYLKANLRLMVGRDAKAPKELLDQIAAELQPMYEAAQSNNLPDKKFWFREYLLQEGDAAFKALENRQRFFKKVKQL